MTRAALVLALAAALPAVTLAQQPEARPTAPPARDAADTALAAMRANWRQVTAYITQAAEELSEADYAYRPVETVRTFGQLIGHIAGSQFTMCAAALGDSVPEEDAVEKSATTKAALVQALHESTAYCARAYGQSGAAAAMTTQLYGQTMPRAHALALNAVHNGEHYGNIVTYMRMKGMVPPSSRPPSR
ncbi:MAG TPA: DinB family protein [Gemmatimonadaceae bacterium]|nr:DinB family protein [Gemmatimonadaceae bacterium]